MYVVVTVSELDSKDLGNLVQFEQPEPCIVDPSSHSIPSLAIHHP